VGSFLGTLQRLATTITPWFLQGPNFGAFNEAVGLVLDSSVDTLVAGLQLAQPLRCDVSALPHIATDRDVLLFATEPIASRRFRLSQWLQLHRLRGTHFGEMRNLQPFWLGVNGLGILPTIRIVHQSGTPSGGGPVVSTWHTLDPLGNYTIHRASPSNWNWDGRTTQWARWWCILHLPVGYSTAITYNSGHAFDSGPVYDGVSAAAIADLVGGLREAKAAHSRLAGLILTTLQPTDTFPGGGHPFDPTATAYQDASGWTSLPTGYWGSPAYPFGTSYAGLNSRPPWASVVYEDNP
jgi:hypothetical protein